MLRQKGVIVDVYSDEPCVLKGSGTITVPDTKTVLTLVTARATLKATGTTKLKLTLRPSALSTLERALRRANQARARITVRARDRAGNVTSATRTYRLTSG